MKVHEASTWYQKLYSCPFCIGFWFGMFFLIMQDIGIFSPLFAFIVAILTYLFYLIDKALTKYIYY